MEAITIAIGELTGRITYTWVSRTVLRSPFCVKVCPPYRLEDVKVRTKHGMHLHHVRNDGSVRIYPILRGAWKDE
jgi:hypothetical protein